MIRRPAPRLGPAAAAAIAAFPSAASGEKPAVWVFAAVGTPSGAVVRGRAFRKDPDRGTTPLSRNLRSILRAHELRRVPGVLDVGGRKVTFRTDAEGFFAVEILGAETPLPLGEHAVVASLKRPGDAGEHGRGRLIVAPDVGLSVISDFDDTVAVTNVTRPGAMLGTVLFAGDAEHPVAPGMAELYRCLALPAGRAFHYLSGTPVWLYRRTERFLSRHRFPPGAILLRVLEAESVDPFAYKPPRVEAIARALPRHAFVLVGDSGERDPEVYARSREALGDRVRAVFIRRVTAEPRDAPRFQGAFVFDRAREAAAEAARLGFIDAECAAGVPDEPAR